MKVMRDSESTGNSILYHVQGFNKEGDIVFNSSFLSYNMLDVRQAIIAGYSNRREEVRERIVEWRVGAAPFDTNKMLSYKSEELLAKPVKVAA